MTTVARWVLIPAKPSWLAKQRLGHVISSEDRVALAHYFLDRLLGVLNECQAAFAEIVVMTIDPSLADIAHRHGATVVADPPDADLNGVLEAGRAYVVAHGATELVVLPTDLPYLAPAALDAFLQATHGIEPLVAIAPDEHGDGTNALLLRPPTTIPFQYGVGSAVLHQQAAQVVGVPVRFVHNTALARDMDRPADWLRWREHVDDPLPQFIYSEQGECDCRHAH